MTHPEYIDPTLAGKTCTAAELAIIHMRNRRMSWTDIANVTHRTRGTARAMWGSANRKVNGGYVPVKQDAHLERLQRLADPDIKRGLRGIPVLGTGKSGDGIIPGKPSRSGKDA